MEDACGVECIWSDPKDHPQCPHGPTLLFGKYIDGELQQFYACAACRDRKSCKFYSKRDAKMTKERKAFWEKERKKFASRYHHQKCYIRYNEIIAEAPERRCYCHNCDKLISIIEKDKHNDHKLTEGLTDYQMKHPTEILKPLDDSRKEAQYFFSKKSTEELVNILVEVGAKQVLCIGTPRIHEYITENYEDKISTLLLDIDGRFHNFFGPLSYCWYNLLNHHFFNEDARDVFKDFLTQNKGQDTYLICDPPFGGRLEALSWSIKKISDLHKKWNNIENENDGLKIIFIFPYFMENVMKHKSNPPSVEGGLKDLKMSDYKVDYDNHSLFTTEKKNNKLLSPIRIFTNIPLNLFKLPESDGYRHCRRCQKWVAPENKHCRKCKNCTSKNGKTYKHCNACERCVKPSWIHCKNCNRCALEKHVCGQKPKVRGKCFKCNEFGHTEKDCTLDAKNSSETSETRKGKKRKVNNAPAATKKRKVDKGHKPEKEEDQETVVSKIKKSTEKILAKTKTQQKTVLTKPTIKTIKRPKISSKTRVKRKLCPKTGIKSAKMKIRKGKPKCAIDKSDSL